MKIKIATMDDYDLLLIYDDHIDGEMLKEKIESNRMIVAFEDNQFVGWLRFGMFWDEIPFMNLLFIVSDFRNKGYGKKIVEYWEDTMRHQGFETVMTSTMVNEEAQHFYRKLGYCEIGGFILQAEPMEMMMTKNIGAKV